MLAGQFVIAVRGSNPVPRNGQEAHIKYPCLWSGLDDFIEQLLCI